MTPSKLGPPPAATSAAVSRSMRANVAKNTSPELRVRAMLRKSGFPGYRLHWRGAPGRPDIAYPGRRVAIFVNGCFWHRCPKCKPPAPKSNADFWNRKFALNAERDARKVRELEASGWTVFTVWECETRDDAALARVLDVLAAR